MSFGFHMRLWSRLSRIRLSARLNNASTSDLRMLYATFPMNGAMSTNMKPFNSTAALFRFFTTTSVHKYSSKTNIKGPLTRTVLLVDETGQNRGLMPLKEAIDIARSESLELVEVKTSTESSNSVFKLFSSKALFDESVRKRKQNKAHSPKVKEIVITGRIAPQDLKWKVKRMREFLEGSHPVKLSVTHTSRKASSMDDKLKLIEQIQEDVKDFGIMDGKPKAAGNFRVKCIFKSVPQK